MSRTDLTEKQWQTLKLHLPANPKRGRDYRDHRQVINGMLWRLKNGAPWREIPDRYGPWQTCWDRFTKWEQDGTWKRILQRLQAQADAAGEIDWKGAALDSSHAKAHRCATGARKQPAEGEKKGV